MADRLGDPPMYSSDFVDLRMDCTIVEDPFISTIKWDSTGLLDCADFWGTFLGRRFEEFEEFSPDLGLFGDFVSKTQNSVGKTSADFIVGNSN